ncbi:MAG: hypothetical protein KGL67_02150 [Patescibacteria group bacterium]|nr:hypothetical protein [Patescibacteria group bacterium]
MKAQLIGKNKKGFATLEILIAFAVIILCIGAVIMVVFGNQSVTVDSQTNNEAISKAQALLEQARANSRLDFNLVNPTNTTETSGSLTYTKTLDVTQADLFTKKVTATISWQTAGRTLSTIMSTLLTNPQAVGGGDTCSSVVSGRNWTNPQMTSYQLGADLLNDPSSDYLINAIDVYNKKMYIAANVTHGNNANTFFVFDVSTPTNPVFVSQIDNDTSVQSGLNAMRVFGNYAYAANATGSNFSNCTSGICGQLQVIDISTNPPKPKLKFKIPGVVGSSGKSIGTSIFYNNGYVYLGLAKVGAGSTNGEFNIIDVHDPLNPIFKGSYVVGNAVNAIFVKNGYAYIATANNENMTILDVSNPSNPVRLGGYTPPGGNNGESVYVVGNTAYLGRTFGSSEFNILNTTIPTAVSLLGSKDLPGNTASINGLIVRDYLAFLITGNDFQVWNISNPTNITQWATPVAFPNQGGGSSPGTATDCEGNYFFVGSLPSGNQKGYLSIIGPGP